MVVPTPKSDILLKTYLSTVNIVQLYNLARYNLAKLRKWKKKYTIQFLKVKSPPLPLPPVIDSLGEGGGHYDSSVGATN